MTSAIRQTVEDVLIVDDERSAREILRIILSRHVPEIKSIRQASNATEALEMIRAKKPDLLFLDIEMPGKNAFDLLENLTDAQLNIIFTTAYNQYAIKAIRFSALDYILKPIEPEELLAAIERYRVRQFNQQQLINNLIGNTQKQEGQLLAIPTEQGTVFFDPLEIIRCEAQINYTLFIFNDGSTFLSSKTLKEYDELLLDHPFIRVHRSHLVNYTYLSAFQGENTLSLSNGDTVPVSRRKKACP